MAMPHFQLHQPKSLEEALDLVAAHRSSVKIIAGGTDLLLKMRHAGLAPQHVVSLNRVSGLTHVSYTDEDGLVIGAAAKISTVAEHPDVRRLYPALAHACDVMATVQIRNMGTVVGNLANAAPSADTAAPLMAYGASVVLVERGGRRQVKLPEFFTGPGATVRESLEVIEAIRVPAPMQRTGSSYHRLSARSKVDIAAVGVASCLVTSMAGEILAARVALSSVAPTPVRAYDAEELLAGQTPDEMLLKRAAVACVRASSPIDDVRATANYRRRMVQVLAERSLLDCLAQLEGGKK